MEVNGDQKLSFLGELSLLGEGKINTNYNTRPKKQQHNITNTDTMCNPNSIYWGYLKAFLSATVTVALRFDRWDVIVKERLTTWPEHSFCVFCNCSEMPSTHACQIQEWLHGFAHEALSTSNVPILSSPFD